VRMSYIYTHYVMPENALFRPSTQQIHKLLQVFKETGWFFPLGENNAWMCTPDQVNHTIWPFTDPINNELSKGDFQIVSDGETERAILTEKAFDDTTATCSMMRLSLADDFIEVESEVSYALSEHTCTQCQRSLGYHLKDFAKDLGYPSDMYSWSRIYVKCPECDSPYNPSSVEVQTTNFQTGDIIGNKTGGSAYRFAFEFEFDEGFPNTDIGKVFINPELLSIITDTLDTKFVERGHIR